MTIKFQHPYSAQGDLNIFSAKSIPSDLVKEKPDNIITFWHTVKRGIITLYQGIFQKFIWRMNLFLI
jgi:hypothetical protein